MTMTRRRLAMTRRVAFLFCCTVLVATSAHAGARRITPMDRFLDAACEASPEVVALDPIQKALRDLAAALAASKLPPTTLTLDGGAGTLSIYCRQPCLGRCLQRSEEAYDSCAATCDFCPPGHDTDPEHPCVNAMAVCINQCQSDKNERDGACNDACCFDY